MNRLHPLRSALLFIVRLIGVILIASIAGALGMFVHAYVAAALFITIFIVGMVGALKLYVTHQPSATSL